MQKPQIYAREEGRPEKGEAKNGFVPPDDQSDDRRDAQGYCKFIQVDFLQAPAACAIFEIQSYERVLYKVSGAR